MLSEMTSLVVCAKGIAMKCAFYARRVQPDLVHQAKPVHQAGETCFTWSRAKIRIAGLVLLGAAALAALSFLVSAPLLQWICLAWLGGVAILLHCLSRRANDSAVVLSVGQRGIFDSRLMSKPIAWYEIKGICAVDPDRSHVVDIKLRWPKNTLGEARWPVRIGAYCQTAYGVPAVTISLLLLEGKVTDVLNAVAQYRPDLLDPSNKRCDFELPLGGRSGGVAAR
jgi:hypothetical protein